MIRVEQRIFPVVLNWGGGGGGKLFLDLAGKGNQTILGQNYPHGFITIIMYRSCSTGEYR